MKKIEVYEPPACCASCAPSDKVGRFTNDLDWLKKHGVEIERFNFSTNPAAFANQDAVRKALEKEGNGCLPLILADGVIVSRSVYPARSELANFAGISADDIPPENTETVSACGPGCNCGTSPVSGKAKAAVGIVVLLAAGGIFAFKMAQTKPVEANAPAPAFAIGGEKLAMANPATQTPKANTAADAAPARSVSSAPATALAVSSEKPNTDNPPANSPEANKAADAAPAGTVSGKAYIGDYLDSMSSLNKVAISNDAVFILIPAKKDEPVKAETDQAVMAAQRTLKDKNITVGLFTLETSAPEYSDIIKQVAAPVIIVASKGRGMGVVSGEVTEAKLLQALVASSRAGGCGGSKGCGPATPGCK